MKQFIEKFLFIFLLIAASCNKETGPTFVSGTVQDKTTFTGVDNANVGLFEYDDESAFGLSGTLLDEVYSDASGNFTFNFTARKGYSYYVQAIKEQYWNDQSNNVTFIDVLGGTSNIYVYLQPEGYLNIHYLNVPPTSSYDEFGINGYVADSFTGADIDTIVVYTIFGNDFNELHWAVDYNPTESDTLYCPAFDTTYYEIFY